MKKDTEWQSGKQIETINATKLVVSSMDLQKAAGQMTTSVMGSIKT